MKGHTEKEVDHQPGMTGDLIIKSSTAHQLLAMVKKYLLLELDLINIFPVIMQTNLVQEEMPKRNPKGTFCCAIIARIIVRPEKK